MLALPDFSTVSEDVLATLSLDGFIDPCPPLLSPQASLMEVAQAMQREGVRCVLLVDQGICLGILTDQEVLAAVAAGADVAETPASLEMLTQVPLLRVGASVVEAIQIMETANLCYLPVVDQAGQICGLVTQQSLATALTQWQVEKADWLPGRSCLVPARPDPMDRGAGLTTLTHIHYQLLSLHHQNRLRVYTRCLKLMGLASQANRATLFERHQGDSDDTWVSLRAAWEQPGCAALLDQPALQNIPASTLQRWHDSLAKGGILTADFDQFPLAEQAFLAPLEAQSVLVLPLRYRHRYFGFLLFTRRSHAPRWASETIKLLRTAAISLSLSFEQSHIQQRLKQTETAFASLFHHIPDPIAITTFPEGRYLLVNQGYAQWLGRSEAEIIGQTPRDFGLVHNRRQFAHLRRRLLQTGLVKNAEIDSCHADGQVKTLLVSSEISEFNGQTCLLSIGKDITERKQIQSTLSAAEARFRAIFEQVSVGICQADLAGHLVDVNPGMCRMLGYTYEELVGKTFQEITHPADLTTDLEHYERLLAGDLAAMAIEKRYLHRDGHALWVTLTVCLVRNSQGEPLFSIGVSQDITDLKQAETALQASHQHITDILESITDAFFALDRHCQFTYLNQRAEQFLQRSRQEVLGQNLWYEFPELLGTLFSKRFCQALTERQSTTFEEYFASAKSWYEVHVYPTQDGLAVYFQDITSRRLAYQQIEHQILREQALNRVIQAIRQSLDLDTIFATAAREVAHLLQVDHVNIQRYQAQSCVWQVVAEFRMHPDSPSLLHGVSTNDKHAITKRLKRMEIVPLSPHDHHTLTRTLPGCWLLVPLPVNDTQPWGCLGIHRPAQAGEVWQPSDIELVTIVADQLAIAIQQAQTLDQARCELEERQRTEARLKEAQRIAHTGNWELHLPSRHLTWSEEMFRIYGLTPDHPPLSLDNQITVLEESDRPQWQHQLAIACLEGQSINLEGSILRPDGCRRFVQLLGQAQRNADGDLVGLVGTLTDITERKQIEERLAYEALHDPLTGIPNRACFMEQLNAAVLRGSQGAGSTFAVLFIDLDRFKVINDSLGHLVGDQLLIECASRLGSVVREKDLVARLGGDEFAILINDIDSIDDPVRVAERIHEVLHTPVILEGREIFISASVGVSSNLTGSVEAVDFLRDADTAMYQAKNNGRGQSALFDRHMYEQVATQLTLESDLQRALERQELALEYQPILEVATGRLVGFEALARWHHPRWGTIAPSTFIPLAEETGLILSIGEWTQKTACQQLQQWRHTFPAAQDLIVSVNLSVKQFANPHLLDNIDATLAATQLSSRHLRLEITESALIENPDTAESLLFALKERGIQLCIDDFGTGYSSLSMVHRFPVQILKIDRSFIHRMEDDPRGVAMVQAILALGHSLGMTAIAEGVETKHQWHQLRRLGCTLAQGYYVAKPLSTQAMAEFLQTWAEAGPSPMIPQ